MAKKWLVLVVAILVLAAGCGQNSGTDRKQNGSAAGGGEQQQQNNGGGGSAPQKEVTIKFHHWYDTEDERLDKVIEQFERQNPGIKVESVRLDPKGSAESMQALDLLAASGEPLDVIMQPGLNDFVKRVGMGLFEPLNEHLDAMGIDMNEEFIVDTSFDGVYYGFPVHYLPWITILNKELLDKAGLDVPKDWTFDDFTEYARKLTDDTGEGMDKQYGTYFPREHSQLYYMALFNQPNINALVSPDGRTSHVTHPAVRKSLEVLQQVEMIDKSALSFSDRISLNLHYAWPYFNQKAAMNITQGHMISRVGGYSQYPATFLTVFAPYPKINKDDEIYLPASINFVGVAATSQHKEESLKFAYFLATEGVVIQEKYLSNWSKVDLDDLVDKILSNTQSPEFVDGESLKHVLKVSKPTPLSITPFFYSEVVNAYAEQVELFLLGGQDIDTTIENAEKAVQRIIDTNQ